VSQPRLLSVRGLSVRFLTEGGTLQALDDVSFDVAKGSAVAIVGESGCGKSVTAQALLRLVPCPPGEIERGEVLLEGEDLLKLSESELRRVRGARVAMVFQEPMTSLNPVYSVGWQIGEALRLHRSMGRREARRVAIEALRKVGFPSPEERIDDYPHQLSGGMRQRVMLAMALVCEPQLLVADEPTTAVDSTVQAQLLDLFSQLRRDTDMSLLLITHDFGVVAEAAEHVVVLYAGQVVERGRTKDILESPLHPYTRALLASIPPTGRAAFRKRGQKGRRLPTIEGTVPDLRDPPIGCRFHDRCPEAFERCPTEAPMLLKVGRASVRCFLHEGGEAGS